MNRKGPWEGYRWQAKHVSPVVSFPPSFARTFTSKERGLGARQSLMIGAWPSMHFFRMDFKKDQASLTLEELKTGSKLFDCRSFKDVR